MGDSQPPFRPMHQAFWRFQLFLALTKYRSKQSFSDLQLLDKPEYDCTKIAFLNFFSPADAALSASFGPKNITFKYAAPDAGGRPARETREHNLLVVHLAACLPQCRKRYDVHTVVPPFRVVLEVLPKDSYNLLPSHADGTLFKVVQPFFWCSI
jgi:hypothetical protein